ncbi:hypothetical protein AB4Z19_15655 [Pseudoduganella sp. RAF19]|uniref:hypothetical protein n=1 Tax=Bacteria TaxID=2 RepID=UPI003F9AB1D8
MSQTFKPSLTRTELSEIKARRDAADIPLLLWEIARLRAVALRADQFLRAVGPLGGGPGIIGDAMRRELDELACIREFDAIRVDIERPGG